MRGEAGIALEGSVGLRDNRGIAGDPGATSPVQLGYYGVQNAPPFALANVDDLGFLNPIDFMNTLGDWTVTCQAFCDANLGMGPVVASSDGRPNLDPTLSSEPVSVSFTASPALSNNYLSTGTYKICNQTTCFLISDDCSNWYANN